MSMKILIIYYSRNGSTKTAALALANQLSAEIEQIGPVKRYAGIFGYFRAAIDSLRGNLPAIDPMKQSPQKFELTVVAAPLWAGHAAPPIRTYLNDHKGEFRKIASLITRGGSSTDQAFAEIGQLSGLQPVAELSLRDKEIKAGGFNEQISGFGDAITREMGG